MNTAFAVEDLEVFLFRVPAEPPVQTSFGIMRERPAVLLRVTARDGAHGWGEVWCNFPSVGPEHRARLVLAYLRPLLLEREWASPRECFLTLSTRLSVLAIQTGEYGPLHQIVAGLDIALWDLVARRADMPLWRALATDPANVEQPAPIPVYASGLNPTSPQTLASHKLDEGYRAFKLKVGFGAKRDDANLAAVREVIGDHPFMVDANQAWSYDESIEAGRRMAQHDLVWLEEPMRADTPHERWRALAREQPLALAAGENVANRDAFDAFMDESGVRTVQPDIGKWGGYSGCLEVGHAALARGLQFCPHWLGGGIGLAASFHLKAAVGGSGWVEVDANPNPLRDWLAEPRFALVDGAVVLDDRPGLGVEPDLAACRDFVRRVSTDGV